MPLTWSDFQGVNAGYALELNERFDQRRRSQQAAYPRAFPPTSPNLCAGICSIAFGLRGPAFSVGGSLRGAGEEAFGTAALLVGSGDAQAALVVVVEDAGPVAQQILAASREAPIARRARAALLVPQNSASLAPEPNQRRTSAVRWAAQLQLAT